MAKKAKSSAGAAELRRIPSVDQLLGHEQARPLQAAYGRAQATDAIREVLAVLRQSMRETKGRPAAPAVDAARLLADARVLLEQRRRLQMRHVINATGIILHTGLGRAVLSEDSRRALADEHASYSLLEVDPATNERRHRETPVSRLVAEITGAEAATVVNNNAAATLIILAALAAGRQVIVARGQLVEIGGTFRLPEVMAQGGCTLVEVGTTNKVYLADYERAITPATALLMVVHTSNYRIVGFTEEPSLEAMVALGRRTGIPVFHDVGSGALVDFRRFGIDGEPVVQESVATGSDILCFSGDKLLGGSQAGIVAGKRDLVERVRRHALFRALRPDKLQLTALEATLQHYRQPETVWETVPTLRMVAMTAEELHLRATRLAGALAAIPGVRAEVAPDASQLGGGSTPMQDLPTTVVAFASDRMTAQQISDGLRLGQPPVFARVKRDRCLFDPRTIQRGEDDDLVRAVRRLLG